MPRDLPKRGCRLRRHRRRLPCVELRGYTQEDFIDGVVMAGASVIHERFKAGAAPLSF